MADDGDRLGPPYVEAAKAIRARIRDGRLQPGDRLDLPALAAELGFSRSTIGRAVRLLQAEGLTETVMNYGSFVARRLPPG